MTPFSYAWLGNLLAKAKAEAAVMALRDWHGQPGLILRHDVDLDLELAYRVATLESELGVGASFFVLTTSDWYNPFSRDNRRLLRAMAEQGFEIGLHFDPQAHEDGSQNALRLRVGQEADALGQVVGRPVTSVSLHNPSVGGFDVPLDGFQSAYDRRIFSPSNYLSDSRMRFSCDPADFVARAGAETVQLLLHPMHYSADGGGYAEAVVGHVARGAEAIHRSFGGNTTYAATIGDSFAARLAESLIRPGPS